MLRLALLVVFITTAVGERTPRYSVSGPHIADVNILLPPKMTYPVEYRLQGSDGCFKWSWDHRDILSVLPEYNMSSHCSTSARLRSIAPYTGRKETAVYATDVYTGNVIRCKVFIDNFSRIQIFHNSIKLDLDGLATLRIRAFDAEDNVFSSLVGLQFRWQLVPEIAGVSNHLVHVPLKDSPLSDCGGLCGDLDIQIKLEDSGVYSDLYVVKGVRIGHENVSVRLLEPQLNHMADKIVLTVAEAMSLDPPSPVFVLIGAVVHYSLKVIRGNIPQVVSLPSPHHQWSVSNSSVAQVDSMMGLTNALSLGVTSVVVEDTRVVGHKQLSSLNVVLPDTISLCISPLSDSGDPSEEMKAVPSMTRWYIISGCQYLVQLKVFSSPYGQEIYITEADDVKWYNESAFWETFPVPDYMAAVYGSQSRILKATSQGMAKITALLTYYTGHEESKEVLKVVQEVMVCDKVKFDLGKRANISQSLLLPWAPTVYQELELKVTGGCAKTSSDYKWFSSDMAVVSVSTSGVVQAKRPGKATVKVVSIFDALNYDEVLVEVSRPSVMAMLQKFPVETVVGSHLRAAVTMKAPNGAYFYICDAFSSLIKWKTESESFIVVNATEEMRGLYELGNDELDALHIGPPCSLAAIYASGSGQSVLHATLSKEYHQPDAVFHGSDILKATSRIAAYPQLVIRQASDGNQFGGYGFTLAQTDVNSQLEALDQLYLVPGTHLDVMLLGGPEQWDKGVDFLKTVDVINKESGRSKDGILVQKLPGSYRDLYRVSCQMLGTFELVFKRGNLIGDDHPLAVIAEVSLFLTCSFPSSITLITDQPVNERGIIWTATQAERSAGRIRVTPLAMANGRTIRVAAVGITTTGEAFANSSSLSLSWELNNCDGLADWDDAYDSEKSGSSWERFLVLKNESGMCIVRATVVEFRATTDSLQSFKLLDKSENILTDAVRLQLVSTLRVDPEFNLLFFNPNAKKILSITGGSCFLEAVANDSKVVDVVQPPSGVECSQLMLSPKGLGSSVVTVYDIGVSPPLEASAIVLVADLDWIKIVSGEEISLMEGSTDTIEVMAGVENGKSFESSQYAYMNIQVHIEDDVVELVENHDISVPSGGYVRAPKFKIVARSLGITTLHISARQQSGLEIRSHPIKVEVYPPPRIHPHDIFLVPGGSFVVILKGGPTIGVHVEYATMDHGIATVDRFTGQLSAISPGNTTLVAKVHGHGDSVICQAYGNVQVGVPSSVLLNTQSDQIGVGREMPIYPLFPEGDVFSYYELCKDFKWTIGDDKVLSFLVAEELDDAAYRAQLATPKETRFSSFLDENQLQFIQVLHGRSPGRTRVSVSFLCEFRYPGSSTESRSYNASASFLVVSDLPLALGVPATWILPPHYTTSSLLPSSWESYGHWDGQSRRGNIFYSLLKNCQRNELPQKDDISIEKDRIKTRESGNIACIQAKDRTTGRVDIAACIRVAEVTQVRLTSKEFPFHVVSLAVGGELEIPIRYHDYLGYPFYEAYNVAPVYVDTSYPNIVSINTTQSANGSVLLKGMQNGRALMRVSINNYPQKSDYMLISVGARLNPRNPVLHVGSYLNFTVEGRSAAGYNNQASGQWFSGNGSVLSVDKTSGIARAVGEGSAQVFYKSAHLKLQTPVIVLTGDAVQLDSPKEMLTNVPYPTRGYNFSVRFSDTYGKKLKSLGDLERVAFDCQVDPPFVGYAKPWLNLDSGMAYCLFFPYTPEHLAHSMGKSKDVRSDVSVSITASLREASNISGSASALFVGGFSILEKDKDSLQLDLTPDFEKATITILGNTDVEIHWKARDSITISPIYSEGFGIGRKAQYEVKVLSDKRFKDKIGITLPATGQKAEIDISFEPGRKAASVFNTSLTFWASVLGSFVLLIVTVAIFMRFLDKPDGHRLSYTVTTSSITAPVTPERSSPTVSSDQSPRTPQPFVDYVRRTIDETPYYRREGRRRFNPQNTF